MKNILALVLILILSGMLYAQTNTFPSSGNVGIGTTSPAAKLSFNNVNDGTNGADGITWHNPGPLDYGIYRTAGPWSGPDYQQLKLSFHTGIVLYPGSAYGKSYVDIQGGGLRVSSGNVGIGTTTPGAKMHVVSNTNLASDNTVKFEAPMTGSSASHGHWGTTGDWYIRSAHQSGKVIIQDYVGGNVGIGTDAPVFKLDVQGFGARVKNSDTSNNGYTTFRIQGPDYPNGLEIDFFGNNNMTSDLTWSYGGGAGSAAVVNVNPKPLVFGTNNQGRMLIDGNGNVGIGTSIPTEKLTVNGTIYGKEVKVDLSVPGPDYVFEKDYDLPSLEEIKDYIDKYKHLPEVPSAKEMEENGIKVGEMNMILLKKVEEMTLYILQQQRQLEAQGKEIQLLKDQIH